MSIQTLTDSFHLWAFHTAYRSYPDTMNSTERFARAIVASSGDVPSSVILGWKAVMRDIRQLNRQFSPGVQRRTMEYWGLVYAAIQTRTGIKVTLRAWELDRLNEIDVEDDEPGGTDPEQEPRE